MNDATCEESITQYWVGLDVSKLTFDAAVIGPGQRPARTPLSTLPAACFPRNPQGVRAFLQWVEGQIEDDEDRAATRCIMEATGRYSTELVVWLVEARPSLAPAIEPPRQTAAFIKSLGTRNRTDALAARALAIYGLERQPRAYAPPAPEELELRDVCRYRDTLVRQRTAASNQAGETSASAYVRANLAKRIRLLDADIKRTEAEMRRLVAQDTALTHDIKLLATIYGVGFLTAAVVRAELGDLRRFERARQLSAFAGLNPAQTQSGTSVHRRTRMGKQGNARARQALYLSSMVAIQGQNDLQRTYRNHLANGKAPMAALGAIMRKLLCIMRAVLIHENPYDPQWKLREKPAHAAKKILQNA